MQRSLLIAFATALISQYSSAVTFPGNNDVMSFAEIEQRKGGGDVDPIERCLNNVEKKFQKMVNKKCDSADQTCIDELDAMFQD